ncbi:MAG: glutaredoxin domain-containing protein [Chloroflexota bacterium]
MPVETDLRAGELTVYGSPTCPWCQKQETYLEEQAIDYTFVDCTSNECPDYVTGFPTLNQDGDIMVGYTEV